MLTVNLRAPAAWIHAVLLMMRAQGSGRIINVSSPATTEPLPYISAYGAAKAALTQFTACLAPEIAPDGLVTPAIGPAALTDMTRSLWETNGLPQGMRERMKAVFTADPEGMLRRSLELFRCLTTGGPTTSAVSISVADPKASTHSKRSQRSRRHPPANSWPRASGR